MIIFKGFPNYSDNIYIYIYMHTHTYMQASCLRYLYFILSKVKLRLLASNPEHIRFYGIFKDFLYARRQVFPLYLRGSSVTRNLFETKFGGGGEEEKIVLENLINAAILLCGSVRCVVVNVLNCNIVISEFELLLLSCYNIFPKFSGKYCWERYEALYPTSYGINSTSIILLQGWLWY